MNIKKNTLFFGRHRVSVSNGRRRETWDKWVLAGNAPTHAASASDPTAPFDREKSREAEIDYRLDLSEQIGSRQECKYPGHVRIYVRQFWDFSPAEIDPVRTEWAKLRPTKQYVCYPA